MFALNKEELSTDPDGSCVLLGWAKEPMGESRWLAVVKYADCPNPVILKKRLDKVMNPSYVIRSCTLDEAAMAWSCLENWVEESKDLQRQDDLQDAHGEVWDQYNQITDLQYSCLELEDKLKAEKANSKPLNNTILDLKKQVQASLLKDKKHDKVVMALQEKKTEVSDLKKKLGDFHKSALGLAREANKQTLAIDKLQGENNVLQHRLDEAQRVATQGGQQQSTIAGSTMHPMMFQHQIPQQPMVHSQAHQMPQMPQMPQMHMSQVMYPPQQMGALPERMQQQIPQMPVYYDSAGHQFRFQ